MFNVVTTNPNGRHDFLRIRNIELFPANRVQIFDRWGNSVFDVNGYDNADRAFRDVSDSGKDLPKSTYYYLISIGNGEPLAGFFP